MARFRQNHQRSGRGASSLVRLLLFMLIVFAALLGFIFYQLNAVPAKETLYFLPVGGKGKVSTTGRIAISELEDGSPEWIAWELGPKASKMPPLPEAWYTVFPDTSLPAWATEFGSLQVIAGVTDSIGYRVVLDLNPPEQKGVGFLWAKTKPYLSSRVRMLPIDSIEKVTGLDFFPEFIAPVLQDSLEGKIDSLAWSGVGTYFDSTRTTNQ